MKRVSKNWIVVDFEDNKVGFVVPDSLALVEAKSYGTEGYLTGAMGLTDSHSSKDYIYLWFSSGDICLVDGMTL